MKETREKSIDQKSKDDATMNFVSYQAQEAILDPNMPEARKNEIVGTAVGTILRIAEKRNVYNAPSTENRQMQEPRTIYDSRDDEDRPEIVGEINKYLKEGLPKDADAPTVESIAKQLEIHRQTLYDWIREDQEFSETLERLENVQQNDPFKTTPDKDRRVNSMMIALLLMETRDRHFKSQNS
jgi:transposase-like protein